MQTKESNKRNTDKQKRTITQHNKHIQQQTQIITQSENEHKQNKHKTTITNNNNKQAHTTKHT